jgi:RNA polymerase sigma factor for flagellar operon FliA
MPTIEMTRAESALHYWEHQQELTAGTEASVDTGVSALKHEPALWQAFHEGDMSARDTLLNEHLGLVHMVARRMSRTLAADVDFDDLVSSGSVGLMNALEAFDLSRGLAFSTFAAPRIRGAILDELRRQDHVPRSLRRTSREIAAAREALTRANGLPPDDRELALHMGVDLDTLWRWQSEIMGIVHMPIDRPSSDDERRVNPQDVLPGTDGLKIEDEINLRQEVGALREAIMKLKEKERVVLSLYYFEELKQHEVAAVVGLTESRVSQIRSNAIRKLRARMAPLREQVA